MYNFVNRRIVMKTGADQITAYAGWVTFLHQSAQVLGRKLADIVLTCEHFDPCVNTPSRSVYSSQLNQRKRFAGCRNEGRS
jgi:hypothetical protein